MILERAKASRITGKKPEINGGIRERRRIFFLSKPSRKYVNAQKAAIANMNHGRPSNPVKGRKRGFWPRKI